MKIIKFVKDVWKQNKWNYLISCGVLLFCSYVVYAKLGNPMIYTYPVSVIGSFSLMYAFAFILYWKGYKQE